MLDFVDRVALVAGGAGAIGGATATLLASLGARVWIVDLERTQPSELAQRIGMGMRGIVADLTEPSGVNSCIDQIMKAEGRLDVAITTVGWSETHPFAEEDGRYWRKVIDINYVATVHLCHAVVGPMARGRYGRIITTSSDAGRVGTRGESVYAGAKAGVIGFTKSLAREVARDGITANCVSPGPTESPLLHHQGPDILERIRRQIPLKRFATPEEQAIAYAFFASERAGYITGQVLSVSGGLTMAG